MNAVIGDCGEFSFVCEWCCWQVWHATACRHTLALCVAREDDELMSSGQMFVSTALQVIDSCHRLDIVVIGD